MTSHHVTCHVTSLSHASSLSNRKEKEKENKIPIKSENNFKDYLVGRKTRYFWNNFSSSSFNVDVRVGQGSALSTILSTLYLSPLLYIFEK